MSINLTFSNLSQWQKVAFGAALLERMLPNYQLFSEATEFGEPRVLRSQLDLIWQWLDKSNRVKINYTAQLTKLELQIPDPENFDTYGVYPALDTCMAMTAIMQSIQDIKTENFADVSRLSENSVLSYVELMLEQEGELTESMLLEHPLTQWEHATQQELFEFVSKNSEDKASAKKLKSLALSEGLSNLGIEI